MEYLDNNLNVTIEYIISFLVGDNNSSYVKYIDLEEARLACKSSKGYIYIIKSNFFSEDSYGKESSLPKDALQKYEGVPFFYGESKEEWVNDNCLVYADIIATSYYIISRYEEMVKSDLRDKYGNFPASESILVKNSIIDRPIVDEFGELLRRKLCQLGYKVDENKNNFSKIYITHDMDYIFYKYNFLLMIKVMGKRLIKHRKVVLYPLLNWLGIYNVNPCRTWNYMLVKERELALNITNSLESICFVVATDRGDKFTSSYIRDKKTKKYLNEMIDKGAEIGLHTSFDAANSYALLHKEMDNLQSILGRKVKYQRNHYLRQLNPSDISKYENIGITDDFTTGFNEITGFRLGTCHPIRWIDPKDAKLHNIILHGMHIMDGTLIGKKPYQMELSFDRAKNNCAKIIDEIYRYGGELDLLIHNTIFDAYPNGYMKDLYNWILNYIQDKVGKK